MAGTVRPLDAYLTADDTARVISRARIIVGDACMRRFGFAPDPRWTPAGAPPKQNWARYGLWDAATAAEHGYQSPELPDENTIPTRYLDPDAISVYQGDLGTYHGQPVPAGGCQGQEVQAVIAGAPSDFDPHYLSDLDAEALTRATQDSRVTSRIDQWKTCMDDVGFQFSDPLAPFDYWATRRGDDKNHPVVSAAERETARTDLACKKSTGLLGTWLSADVAYQHAIIEREGQRLTQYQNIVDAFIANANHIIETG